MNNRLALLIIGICLIGFVSSFGTLDVNITYPEVNGTEFRTGDTNLTINATVTCVGGECGIISALLRYNVSSANPDTNVNTTYTSLPFSYKKLGANLSDGWYPYGPGIPYRPFGITFDPRDNSFWVVDGGFGAEDFVYHYNSSFDNQTDGFFIRDAGADRPISITFDPRDNSFWIIDNDDNFVYHFNSTGDNQTDGFDIQVAGVDYPAGITFDPRDNSFWVVEWNDDFIYHFNSTGDNQTDGFDTNSAGADTPYGIAFDPRDNSFWVVDWGDQFVYHFNSSGDNQTDGFEMDYLGVLDDAYSLTLDTRDNSFWLVDTNNDFVYHMQGKDNLHTSYRNLSGGQVWNMSWTLNVTSTDEESYLVDIIFNSSHGAGNVPDNHTDERIINIIDATYPEINITFPINNTVQSDIELDIEYTHIEPNPDTCWYTNDTNAANITLASCETNITNLIWSQGEHNVTIWINDTEGNVNFTYINFSVDSFGTLDVNITYPETNGTLYNTWNDLTINASVSCEGFAGQDCGVISALARYNVSGANPDTNINTTYTGLPFSYKKLGTNLSDGFRINGSFGGAENPTGIAFDPTDNSFWVVDGGNGDDFVYHFNSTGDNQTDGFDISSAGAENSGGIAFDPTDNSFWIVDLGDDFVYHFNSTGDNQTDGFDIYVGPAIWRRGITFDPTDNSFWEIGDDDFVYHFNSSGDNQTDGFYVGDSGNAGPRGITFDPTDNSFWIIDGQDDFVYHFNSSGDNQTDGFSTASAGANNVGGIVFDPKDNTFWITDSTDDFAYHFSGKDNLHNSYRNLSSGQTWNMSWVLNVTSTSVESYLIDVLFNSSHGSGNVVDNDTDERLVRLLGVGEYNLSIIVPTTASPLSTSAYENISVRFLFLRNGINMTSGVSMNNVTIEGVEANVVESEVPECSQIEFGTFDSPGSLGNWETYYAVDSGCVFQQDTDGTLSGNTGPCAGASNCATDDAGYDDNFYAYVEASPGDCDTGTGHAYLQYNDTDMDTYSDVKFTFAYNMYGNNMGNLSFQIDDGGWKTLWSLTGDQGTAWGVQEIDLSSYSGTRDIRFDYYRNGLTSYTGDVAIDVSNVSNFGTSLEQEFTYTSGRGWEVNVTAPDVSGGLKDLFVNVTWSGNEAVDNETESINYSDTTYPEINITSPINNSVQTDVNLDIEYVYVETNPDTCWYEINNSGVNTTLGSCGDNITSVTWGLGNHNVTIWINDTSGNVNSTIVNFTITGTSTPPVTPSSGGGSSSGGSCSYDWNCTMWVPTECPHEGVQQRVCINRGTCKDTTEKPDEIRFCSEPLFDIFVEVANKEVCSGRKVNAKIKLENYGKIKLLDGFMTYWVSDENNKTIAELKDTRSVEHKDDFEVDLDIPEKTPEGTYRFYARIDYEENKTALAGESFEIVSGSCIFSFSVSSISDYVRSISGYKLVVGASIIIILICVIFIRSIRKKKRKTNLYQRRIRRNLNKINKNHLIVLAGFIFVGILFVVGRELVGLVVDEPGSGGNWNFLLWILIIGILGFSIFRYKKKIFTFVRGFRKTKFPKNSLRGLIGKKVYYEDGRYLGIVEEINLKKHGIDGLRIKLDNKKFSVKGIIAKYNCVKNVGDIVFVHKNVLKVIK